MNYEGLLGAHLGADVGLGVNYYGAVSYSAGVTYFFSEVYKENSSFSLGIDLISVDTNPGFYMPIGWRYSFKNNFLFGIDVGPWYGDEEFLALGGLTLGSRF